MLTGDFTKFASPACNGGSQIKLNTPFVDNRIDPSCSAGSRWRITSKLPKADDACGRVQYTLPTNTDESQFVRKLDHQWSASQSVFGRYIAPKFFQQPPYETSGVSLLTDEIGGRDNLAQSIPSATTTC